MEKAENSLPKPKQFEGMSQFRPPLCYELVGRKFDLVMDDGYDYTLEFLDREKLSWTKVGYESYTLKYDCLKGDEDTYFVNLEKLKDANHTVYTYILDLEQSLVTWVTARMFVHPDIPKLPYTHFEFGAIRKADGTVPTIRHGYTAEMVGTAIEWNYGTFKVVHVYSSERYHRADLNKMRQWRKLPEGAPMRVPEDPSDYVKIKDGLYVFSLIEERGARSERKKGNNLLFLMNLNRMYDVGRSYGHNDVGDEENYTYGAYGEYYDYSETLKAKSTEYIR